MEASSVNGSPPTRQVASITRKSSENNIPADKQPHLSNANLLVIFRSKPAHGEPVERVMLSGFQKTRYYRDAYHWEIAAPISAGESSWMKWVPFTVTSVWLGHVRQNSR